MSTEAKRPNIILLMADQLNPTCTGFAGSRVVSTPHLDAIAARGVVFDSAFVQCPVCMASRAAIHTGRFPDAIRVRSMGLLPPTEITMAETLKRAGYATGMFGKLHLTPQQYTLTTRGSCHPVTDAGFFLADAGIDTSANRAALADPAKRNYGFDHSVGVEDFLWGSYLDWLAAREPKLVPHAIAENMGAAATAAHYGVQPVAERLFPELGIQLYDSRIPAALHPSAFIVEQTLAFIREHREGPFYAHCSFVDPHHPFNAPAEFARRYPAGEMEPPGPLDVARCYPAGLPAGVRASMETQHAYPDEAWRAVVGSYYGMVSHLDWCVGMLTARLDSLGLLESTIIVFMADHGEYIGDHRLLKKGSLLFDSLMRVPLVVAGPVIAGARGPAAARVGAGRRAEMVQEIDVYPTVMELAGLSSHGGVQGRSLVPLLAAGGASHAADAAATPARQRWEPYDAVFCGLDDLANPIFANPVYAPSQAIRTAAWKLDYFPHERTGMLYDLVNDPGETVNLFDDPGKREQRDELLMMMLDHLYDSKDPLPLRLSQA